MSLAILATVRRSWDADAGVYLKAVEQADGQQLEPYVAQAINQFVLGCKADGSIWSAIKASCILMGARTLSGALTPLVGQAPTNNGPFVSGDYNRRTGLVGNGATKYINTNRAGNADPQNDVHFCVYATTYSGQSGYRAFMGSGDIQTGASNIFWNGPSVGSGQRSRNITAQTASPNIVSGALSPGLFGISRNSSATYSLRANQTTISVGQPSETSVSANWWVFTTNNNGSVVLPTSSRLNFYSTGTSLTLATLESRLATLTTAIGAAIP